MDKQRVISVTEEKKRQQWLTIGQLAHLSGVNAKAIRYYESIGLLPLPRRSENGYRCYSQADVNRLTLLRRLRLLGVSLETLKPLLIEAPDRLCVEIQQKVLQLIGERMRAIDQEIRELHLLHRQVEHYHEQLLTCHPDAQESFGRCRDLSCLAFTSETTQQEEERHAAVSNPQ
jgi:MerR family copper efflux transcriptional regulator